MAFFNSLFGKRQTFPPPDPNAIKEVVAILEAYCRDVMRHTGESAFIHDGLERQVLSIYAFGGLHVLSQQKAFCPPHAHAVCLVLFKNFFGYSAEDSAAKAQACIDASADRASNLNPIIHRGIDGFLSWQEHRDVFDAADFKDVISKLQQPA